MYGIFFAPLLEQTSLLWSEPAGARRRRTQALRRRAPTRGVTRLGGEFSRGLDAVCGHIPEKDNDWNFITFKHTHNPSHWLPGPSDARTVTPLEWIIWITH